MTAKLTTIGFDADDTLWQNEQFFRLTHDRFAELLTDFTEEDHLAERLLDAERRNLGRYGFGVKGFVLSMIETAIEVSNSNVSAKVIQELIEVGQEMLSSPINLLPSVQETVETLAGKYYLILITKGDLLDQERKLAQSGLGDYFDGVEIVSNKTPETYTNIFDRHGKETDKAMMVGNSMRSDVLPAIEAGCWGVFVPHELTWSLEHATAPRDHPKFYSLTHIGDLRDLLKEL